LSNALLICRLSLRRFSLLIIYRSP
jgi:hypothetical protein